MHKCNITKIREPTYMLAKHGEEFGGMRVFILQKRQEELLNAKLL